MFIFLTELTATEQVLSPLNLTLFFTLNILGTIIPTIIYTSRNPLLKRDFKRNLIILPLAGLAYDALATFVGAFFIAGLALLWSSPTLVYTATGFVFLIVTWLKYFIYKDLLIYITKISFLGFFPLTLLCCTPPVILPFVVYIVYTL